MSPGLPYRSRRTGEPKNADDAMRPVLQLFEEAGARGRDLLASRLGLLLLWLADDVIRVVNDRLREFAISEKKLDVLLILSSQETRSKTKTSGVVPGPTHMLPTPTGISKFFGINRASATQVIDWLEKRHLVSRRKHPTDKRSFAIEVTAEGHDLVESALPAFQGACAHLVSVLDDRDRGDLARILDKMWVHLKDLPTDDAPVPVNGS